MLTIQIKLNNSKTVVIKDIEKYLSAFSKHRNINIMEVGDIIGGDCNINYQFMLISEIDISTQHIIGKIYHIDRSYPSVAHVYNNAVISFDSANDYFNIILSKFHIKQILKATESKITLSY